MPHRSIRIRRGLEVSLPTLEVGEPGFCTDSYKLYVGTDSGNKPVAAGTGGLPGADGTSGLPNLYDPNDDGVLRILAISGFATNLELEGSTPKAYVSAKDPIIAVQGGTAPFTYYIKKDGGAYGSGSTDPAEELISYLKADVGFGFFWIKVVDSLTAYSEVTVYVAIQNNKGF